MTWSLSRSGGSPSAFVFEKEKRPTIVAMLPLDNSRAYFPVAKPAATSVADLARPFQKPIFSLGVAPTTAIVVNACIQGNYVLKKLTELGFL